MAVVIQPYNPWREQLAAQVLVPMISGALERQRQRDQNRKHNAYLGELASQIAAMTTSQNSNSLPVPDDYNANPWAQAYHRTNSPLTQFDLATADLMPFNTQGAKQQSTPTMTDMLNAIASIRSNPRFSHLSPDVINNLSAPHIQAMEEQRLRDMRSKYATDLNDAQSWDERFNIMTNAILEGLATNDLLKTFGAYAQYRQPYYQTAEMDTGDLKTVLAVNPATGEVSPRYKQYVGVSPNTAATLAMQKYGIDTNAGLEGRRLDILENQNAQNYDIANRQQNELETQGAYEHEKPKLEFITDVDGNRLGINPRTGNVVQIHTPDGKHIKVSTKDDLLPFVDKNGQVILWDNKTNQTWKPTAPDGGGVYPTPRVTSSNTSSNKNMTTSEQAEYKSNDDTLKDLRKQRRDIVSRMGTFADTPNDPMYIQDKQELARIDSEIERIQLRQDEILGKSQAKPTQKSVAWISPDGQRGISDKDIEDVYRRADAREFVNYGINSSAEIRADLQRRGWRENNASTSTTTPPVSRNVPLMPPLSSDLTSSHNVPAPVSTDIHNHSTPEEQKEQIDILNGNRVTSSDIRDPVSGNVRMPQPTSQDMTMATPAPRKAGEVVNIQDEEIPDAVYYNPEQDKDTPKGKILSTAQFKDWLERKLSDPNLAHLTHEQIIQQFISQGLKVRRDTPQASTSFYSNPTAPEEVGTAFHGIDLPGLRTDGAQAASLMPMGTAAQRPVLREDDNSPYNPNGGNYPIHLSAERPITATNQQSRNDYDMPEWDLNNAELLASRRGGLRRKSAARRTAPRAGYTSYEQQRSAIDSSARRHGVDTALIRAIIQTESGWKTRARSKVGAMGLMQLMPKTAQWLGVQNAYDPAQNIEGGSKYIAQLIRQFGGDISKALMAYNCGPGNVKKGRIPAESRRYAQKVMSIYRRLKGQR